MRHFFNYSEWNGQMINLEFICDFGQFGPFSEARAEKEALSSPAFRTLTQNQPETSNKNKRPFSLSGLWRDQSQLMKQV